MINNNKGEYTMTKVTYNDKIELINNVDSLLGKIEEMIFEFESKHNVSISDDLVEQIFSLNENVESKLNKI